MEGEKIVAIYDKEIPKSVIELRSFSGLAKTSPLTKFVRPRSKKGSPVGEEHDKRIILAKGILRRRLCFKEIRCREKVCSSEVSFMLQEKLDVLLW